jgi:Ca2+/Na+ antiporter
MWMPWLGSSLYVANLLLGLSLQLRVINLHRARWVHHVLYFCVFVATAAATVALFSSGRWWALLPTLACLAVLPRFKGGSRPHAILTSLGLLGYVVALL